MTCWYFSFTENREAVNKQKGQRKVRRVSDAEIVPLSCKGVDCLRVSVPQAVVRIPAKDTSIDSIVPLWRLLYRGYKRCQVKNSTGCRCMTWHLDANGVCEVAYS